MERARAAGAAGLIVTLDWTFTPLRATGAARSIPAQLDFKTMAQLAPEVLRRPMWAVRAGRRSGTRRSSRCRTSTARRASSPPTASGWGRRRRPGRTSRGCARCGTGRSWSRASCASTTPAARSTTSARPRSRSPTTAATTSTARRRRSARWRAVVEAVGRLGVEVVLDGGVRRGSDVVKALALGARAVMIGRPYLWGLAADGQAGVENVLDVLRNGHRLHPARARPRVDPDLEPCRPPDPGWLLAAALAELTSAAVAGDLLVVPLGATEQHGPHLPLGTDTVIASALRGSRRRDAVVAPALPYGSSGEHAGFPGTLSIGHAALRARARRARAVGGVRARAVRVRARRERGAARRRGAQTAR